MEKEEMRRLLVLMVGVCVCVGGGGAALEEMIISTSHQCASALHKPPRAVSKCCWQIKAIKERWVGWSPVYYPSHRTFTPSPAHQCEIMVFAFICPRSIFQTSDKRGNWTGNRPKCCKSTKHNYQKALKLPNRIHILKWSNGCPPAIMRVLLSSATSFFWSWRSAPLQSKWSMVSTMDTPPPAPVRPSLCVNALPLSENGSLWKVHYGWEDLYTITCKSKKGWDQKGHQVHSGPKSSS